MSGGSSIGQSLSSVTSSPLLSISVTIKSSGLQKIHNFDLEIIFGCQIYYKQNQIEQNNF